MAYIAPLIRVFVSSTFADFHEERNALQDRVFPALRHYARSKGARFLPIDLRWGVSEAAILEQQTIRICFEEIHRCQDASPTFNFIALLGDRYGSRLLPETISQADLDILLAFLGPAEQELIGSWYILDTNALRPEYVLRPRQGLEAAWSTEQSRMQHALERAVQHISISPETYLALTASVTEREIDEGIFQRATVNHAVCFMRHLTGIPEHLVPVYQERAPESRLRLAQLKHRLRARMPSGMIDYAACWSDDHLSSGDLDRFCTMIERHLCDRIDAAIAEHEKRLAEERGYDLYAFPFAQDRLAHFVGRAEPLEVIQHYLRQPAIEPLVVTGPSGMGKTTLLLQAATLARPAIPVGEFISYFIGGNTSVADSPSLLRDLYAKLLAAYPEEGGDLQMATDPAELEAQVSAFLGLATADHPLIVFIDALDQLRSEAVTRWIPISLPPHVHLVVSLLPGEDCDALRQRVIADQVIEVGPLSEREGAELLRQWLAAAHRTVTPTQHAAILQAFRAYPNPLYLRLLTLEASRWQSDDELLSPLPPDTQAMLHAFFTRLEAPAEHGHLLVAHALGLIAAGKDGLAEDELLDVLSQEQEVLRLLTKRHPDMPPVDRCPPVLWAQLYSDVEALLTERESGGTRLLGFYHRQAEEIARQRYLAAEAGVQRHRELARYFERPRQEPYLVDTPERPFAVVNERMVSELVYQQRAGQLADELKHSLLDATFLQARIQAGGTASAIADAELAESNTTIAELIQALRVSTSVLDQVPHELINQLHGRTANLDAAMHHVPRPQKPHFWLLSRSLPRLGTSVQRAGTHTGLIYYCCFSQDRQRLLTGSSDNTVRLWDVRSHAAIQVFSGHTAMVNSCRFTPDENHIVSGSDDATVRLWDIATARIIHTFYGHTGRVMDCQVTPDGKQLVSASLDGTLRLWDLSTGRTLQVLSGHTDEVYGSTFTPDGRFLISASTDKTLRMWDLQTGRTEKIFSGHTEGVIDCCISTDGKHLISASLDGTLRRWNIQTGRTLRVFRGHTAEVWVCNLTRDGRYLLSSSQDGTVRLWDVQSGQEVRTLQTNSEWVLSSAITPDGQFAASASYDDVLRLWNLHTGEIVWEVRGQTKEVYECTALSDGVHALSASFDKEVRLWDIETCKTVRTFQGHTGPVQSCQVTPNGNQLVSASSDGTLRRWSLKTGKTLRIFRGHTGPVLRCAITPDGKSMVSASADRTLRLWELRTGQTIRVFEGHTAEVAACVVTRQGNHIISASYDSTLRIWDLETGKTMRTFEGHEDIVFCCKLTPDDRFLLSASQDYTLRLWELATGKTVRVFHPQGAASAVYECAITADGAFAVSSDDEGIIRLWNLQTGEEIARWTSDACILSCALHPTQPIVIGGDNRGAVHFLKVDPAPFGLLTANSLNTSC